MEVRDWVDVSGDGVVPVKYDTSVSQYTVKVLSQEIVSRSVLLSLQGQECALNLDHNQ
jgi:hypothetical protein